MADGLLDSNVRAILQDSKGFIWLATSGGISRFDGYRFVNYTVRDGLGHPFVNCLAQDGQGRVWAGTNGGGVARFVEDAGQRAAGAGPRAASAVRAAPAERKFLEFAVGRTDASNRVNAMLFDADGALWCATDDGIYRAPAGSGGAPRFDLVLARAPMTAPSDALADSRSRLWFSFPGEVVEVDHGGITSHTPAGPGVQNSFYRLAVGPNGSVFAATGNDVFEFATDHGGGPSAWRRVAVRLAGAGRIGVLAVDAANGLWLGTRHGLVTQGNGTSAVFTTAEGLGHNDVSALHFDRDGNLWIGTYGGGACEVSRERVLTFSQPSGIPEQGVHQVLEDHEGRIYAVTNLSGLAEIVEGRAIPVPTPGLAAAEWSEVRVFEDARHRWWIGTARGLYSVAGPRLPYRDARDLVPARGTPAAGVATIREDRDHRLWVAFWDGRLYAADAGSAVVEFRPVSLGEGWPVGKVPARILADSTGALWLGDQGAFARHVQGVTRPIGAGNGLPEANPRALFEDSRGWLWVGLRYGGVSVARSPAGPQPSFVNYSMQDGLSSDAIWCIAEGRDGAMFLGTGNGFDRLDPFTGDVRQLSLAGGPGGAMAIDCIGDRHGNIWLATTAGLSRFDPRAVRPAARRPPVYLTRVRVGALDAPVPDPGTTTVSGVEAPRPEDGILIEYVGLAFGGGPPLRYRYRLREVDADWSAPTDQRVVQYAHLDPGSYTFLVQAVDQQEGLVSAPPAVLTFRIPAPWWRHWWIFLGAAALVAAFVQGLYRVRIARLLTMERVRTRIATDLHDDIASDLSMIAMTSEVARSRVPGSEPQLGEWLSTIARTSRELVDSMNDIVWAVNPRRDHLQDLVNRMRRFAGDAVTTGSPELRFAGPTADLPLGPEVRREVFLVFKEALHNLLRHSGCTRCQVELTVGDAWLTLRVQDDGRGFEPGTAAGGNGLPSMRRRAQAVGGDLAIESAPGRGTTVRLKVPLGRRRFRALNPGAHLC